MKRVDKMITSVLINATKSIKGMKRNIPFSKEKEAVRAAKLFWKDYIKKLKGRKVNQNRMNKRRILAQIEDYVILMIE